MPQFKSVFARAYQLIVQVIRTPAQYSEDWSSFSPAAIGMLMPETSSGAIDAYQRGLTGNSPSARSRNELPLQR